jgi:hypothetical protein
MLTGCGAAEGLSDGPVYDSVIAAADESDAVVHGRVGDLRGTEIDDGGNESGAGPTAEFHDLEIINVLRGDLTADRIVVGTSEGEMASGAEVVLFLDQVTSAEAPGIDSEREWYVPLYETVLDVDGSTVTARSDSISVLDGEPDGSGTALRTTLAELDAVLRDMP